jgi:hypothetical protein
MFSNVPYCERLFYSLTSYLLCEDSVKKREMEETGHPFLPFREKAFDYLFYSTLMTTHLEKIIIH